MLNLKYLIILTNLHVVRHNCFERDHLSVIQTVKSLVLSVIATFHVVVDERTLPDSAVLGKFKTISNHVACSDWSQTISFIYLF